MRSKIQAKIFEFFVAGIFITGVFLIIQGEATPIAHILTSASGLIILILIRSYILLRKKPIKKK